MPVPGSLGSRGGPHRERWGRLTTPKLRRATAVTCRPAAGRCSPDQLLLLRWCLRIHALLLQPSCPCSGRGRPPPACPPPPAASAAATSSRRFLAVGWSCAECCPHAFSALRAREATALLGGEAPVSKPASLARGARVGQLRHKCSKDLRNECRRAIAAGVGTACSYVPPADCSGPGPRQP